MPNFPGCTDVGYQVKQISLTEMDEALDFSKDVRSVADSYVVE